MRGIFEPGFAVWRASRVPDDAGGWTTSFALSSNIIGRLSPLSAAETPRAFQERGVVALRFSCPGGTDIKAGDQVRTGSRTVSVDAVRTTSTGLRKECVCEEVNAG